MPRPRATAGLPALLRVFMTPSAIADSHAGLALAAWTLGVEPRPEWAVAAAATSALAYWFGMVTNDLWDLPRDRASAPHRPLPSGGVSVRAARGVAGILAASVLVLGALSGIVAWAAGLLVLIVLYNGGGKRLGILGDALMGGCRALNLAIGAAVVAAAAGTDVPGRAALAAALLGAYGLAVTAVSRLEDGSPERRALGLRPLGVLLVPAAIVALRPGSPATWAHGAVLLAFLGYAWRRAAGARDRRAGAALLVGRALGVLPIVDAALLVALAPRAPTPAPLGVLYGLFVLGWLWRARRARRGQEES